MNLLRRIAWWFNRGAHQAELAEEMALHEEMKQRELEATGLSPEQARSARRRQMGNTTFMREQSRGIWIWPWLDRLAQDVRYALRSARKNPAFSLGVIGITALGVGATTTIFSVVDGVILRRLPYPAAERLIYFDWGSHSPPRFRDWQRTVTSVEVWAASWPGDQDLVGGGKPERLGTAKVSSDFFTVFGGRPSLGRLFTPGDYLGGGDVAAISAGLWRRRFGADSAILGRSIDVGGRQVVVVGVVADGLTEAPEISNGQTDVWFPLVYPPDIANSPNYSILNVIGRLKPGITIEGARLELATVAAQLTKETPAVHGDREGKPTEIRVLPLQKAIVRDVDRSLQTLLAAVGLMLLIACANVTNLYLARSTDRFREMAVRAAVGAGRGRLTRQLVTESATLGIIAGLIGAALAVVGVAALSSLYPGDLPRAAEVGVNGRVLAFAVVVAAVTGVIFGLVPAWTLREARAYDAIKSAGLGDGRRRGRVRATLVVVEVALALVLLVGSGLLFHSFLRIIRVDPGFDPAGLTIAKLRLGEPFTGERRLAFSHAIVDRVRAIPGVTDVAIGVSAPMVRTGSGRCCWGNSEAKAEDGTIVKGRIVLHPVGPGFFETIGARLKGAAFAPNERFGSPYPAVISDQLAARLYGTQDPIGKTLTAANKTFLVRGVVSGLHQWGLDQESGTEIFLPYDEFGGDFDAFNVIVRGSGDAAALIPGIRQAVWDLEPTLPADDIATVSELITKSLAGPRFYSTLMGTFAGLALILAAAGIYASMLYSVRQRTRELGIRVALGAKAGDIASMVVGDAGRLALIGLGLGVVGALALARALGAFLFGIGPSDPVTFAASAVVLGVTVLVAAYLPARRAGRADPLTVLRSE